MNEPLPSQVPPAGFDYNTWNAQNYSPEAVKSALDKSGVTYDTGCKEEIFNFKDEGWYRVRLLPNPESVAQFWWCCWLYKYLPEGLKRGVSPKSFGKDHVDSFLNFVDGHFPWSENNRINQDFRKLKPSYRAVCRVLIRGMIAQDMTTIIPIAKVDPNKSYIWDIPYKRGGFENAIQPQLSIVAQQRINPADPYTGCDVMFCVTGKGLQKEIGNVRFLNDQPGPALTTQEALNAVLSQLTPLTALFERLTDDDLENMLEWYKPFMRLSQEAPARHLDPSKSENKTQVMQILSQFDSNQALGNPAPPSQAPLTNPSNAPAMSAGIPFTPDNPAQVPASVGPSPEWQKQAGIPQTPFDPTAIQNQPATPQIPLQAAPPAVPPQVAAPPMTQAPQVQQDFTPTVPQIPPPNTPQQGPF